MSQRRTNNTMAKEKEEKDKQWSSVFTNVYLSTKHYTEN